MDEIKTRDAGLDMLLRAVRRLDGQLKRTLKRDRLSVTGTRWLLPTNNEPVCSAYTFEGLS